MLSVRRIVEQKEMAGTKEVIEIITKYGSTFYVGFGWAKNGTSKKPQQIELKLLQTKSLCYTIVKNVPRVLLPQLRS